MIPVRLKLSGFLSYRDPVELDFSSFDLACITGENGAGKSSLLDAITWVIFGEARKKDDSIINSASKAAAVTFDFMYENDLYRIHRMKTAGKSTVLEFQIRDDSEWRPLTEKSVIATEKRINQILRMDYDTFVNASFFLQGRADQFAQQKPAKRKEILSSVLGLEIWETYKEKATARRREVERDIDRIDVQLAEINKELGEEPARKAELKALEARHAQALALRRAQELVVEQARQMDVSIQEQRKLVDTIGRQVEQAAQSLAPLQARLAQRLDERAAQQELLATAGQIEQAHAAWQAAREAFERWEEIAGRVREQERLRQPHLDSINMERARLEQERAGLITRNTAIASRQGDLAEHETQIAALESSLAKIEAHLSGRGELSARLDAARAQLAGLKSENDALLAQMNEIKERIGAIEEIDSPECPLCGQPLSPEHRQHTLEQLQQEGTTRGNQFRENRKLIDALPVEMRELEQQLKELEREERERLAQASQLAALKARSGALQAEISAWMANEHPRLAALEAALAGEDFAPDARAALAGIDAVLLQLGYDAAAHAAARQEEQAGRAAGDQWNALQAAQAALTPLEREINSLTGDVARLQTGLADQQQAYEKALAELQNARNNSPDTARAESALLDLQEEENIINRALGGVQQWIRTLADQRTRRQNLEGERERLALQVGRLKTLESAFGKNGVPALLIEQALPDIEAHANDLLDRLSNGSMTLSFVTQRGYKDARREDLKETLDIVVSDGAGRRDYEMFSGGEAFRINFAIRLALSRVLAQRAGARLQTLVIDEGFGTQDPQGIERLKQAINTVQPDFAKILIITHLEELKDAFPHRIEVLKTGSGSTLQVI